MPMRKKLICIIMVAILLIGVMPMQKASASNADQLDISNEFLAILKQFEGFMYNGKPYWDYAQYSIGYGSYCPPEMVEYYTKNPITEAQASEMLVKELQRFITQVRNYLKKYNLTVTQSQFDALVTFTYSATTASPPIV